jgi:septal ring factor EnvC (AmiA/AmiB activator)
MEAQDHKNSKELEAMSAQLVEARSEITKSRNRQKEMARVIARRDQKIAQDEKELAQLRSELQARYEELAAVQRLLLRSSRSGRAEAPVRYLGSIVRTFFSRASKEP